MQSPKTATPKSAKKGKKAAPPPPPESSSEEDDSDEVNWFCVFALTMHPSTRCVLYKRQNQGSSQGTIKSKIRVWKVGEFCFGGKRSGNFIVEQYNLNCCVAMVWLDGSIFNVWLICILVIQKVGSYQSLFFSFFFFIIL